MSVGNIIDHRTNSYCVEVDVVFEPSSHDNNVPGATQFYRSKKMFDCDTLDKTTVADAIKYCEKFLYPITIFLYDSKSNPTR